jgi:hypothetical protein
MYRHKHSHFYLLMLYECPTSYPGSNGKNGAISSVGSLLLSNEGNGGDGGSKGDGYNDNVYDGGNGGFGLIHVLVWYT